MTAQEIVSPELYSDELDGYRISTRRGNEVRRILLPANLNVRAKVWMSRDLRIYSNSEYVYAIPPIALAVFWDKGGRGNPTSHPFSMIFTILSHWLDTSDVRNYLAIGRRSMASHWRNVDSVCPFGASV